MRDELELIKKQIYERDLVVELLESVGCDNVRKVGGNVYGSRPTGDNPTGFSVMLNEDLVSSVWTRNIPIDDIFDLISYFKFKKTTRHEIKKCLPNSKKYIIETLELQGFSNGKYIELPDYNFHLRKLKKHKKKKESNGLYPESILNEFVMLPHIKHINEGLDYDLIKEFELGYDLQTERIIFTYRNKNGELVGIRGRATRKEEENKVKYLPIYNFAKSLELYNVHRAIPWIIKYKKVFMFEGEKSTILATQYEYPNTVAFMGSSISEEQADLIKSIHPATDFIVCMDKDKTTDDVRRAAKYLPKDRTYAIFDTKDYLEHTDKYADSPVDKGKEVWEILYKNHCYKVFP